MCRYDLIKKCLLLFLLLALPGCATIKLGSIPVPEDTTRLRVVVYPVSGAVDRGDWGKSTREFRNATYRQMSRVLSRFGAYQVVRQQEVKAVLGEQAPAGWQLSGNDWRLAFDLGRALYADYVLVVERGSLGEPHYYFTTTLLNVATGARYAVNINHTREPGPGMPRLPQGTAREAYRELFRDAKADLLATALRKGRRMMLREPGEDRSRQEDASRRELERARQEASKQVVKAPRQVQYREAEKARLPDAGLKKLIVYDLNAPEALQVAALILSEALREEILRRGTFSVINRENLAQIIEELKFQQSGLVDPNQAVRLGKGAGAREVLTGSIGPIGQILMLQSKRIEVESMRNISAASLKGEPGREDNLLERLPMLVDRLFAPEK